jgi:hypothetical protein
MAMKTLRTILMLCALAACNLWAAVLFEDSFTSDANWAPITTMTGTTTSIVNGAFRIQNNGTGLQLIKHDMTLPDTFTYSVDFTTSSTNYQQIGLAFCMGEGGTNPNLYFTGYMFYVASLQQWGLMKMGATNTSYKVNFLTSSVNPGSNHLTVVKRKNDMNMYCNGILLQTITDAQALTGGGIALMIPPSCTVNFDNVRVTDSGTVAAARTSFSDDFSHNNLNGWYTSEMSGLARCTLGTAIVANTSSDDHVVFAQGNFGNASLKAIVSHTSGRKQYGAALVKFQYNPDGSVMYKPLSFLIDSAQHYSVSHPDSGSTPVRQAGPKTFIHGGRFQMPDTLWIYFRGPYYAFYVNHDSVTTIDSIPGFSADAVGLYVQDSTQVAFDSIAVAKGYTYTTRIANKWVRNSIKTMNPVFAGEYMIYDIRGRKVGNLKSGYQIVKSRFSPGTYFVVKKAPDGATQSSSPILIVK